MGQLERKTRLCAFMARAIGPAWLRDAFDRMPETIEYLGEGMVRKGGVNRPPSQVTVRPAPPAPMRAKSDG